MEGMRTMRGAAAVMAVLFVAAVVALAGCGSSAAKPDSGAAGGGGSAAGGAGGGGGGSDGGAVDDAGDAVADLATDFGVATSDVAINCPIAAGVLAPAGATALIDDFDGSGKLDGRSRVDGPFSIKEQFDATDNAVFDPVPGVEPKCGAAAPGAAHIRGAAANTGATFAIIFSGGVGDGGKPANRYDASATRGLTFRVALGDARATKLLTVQVNLADSQWDYTKDVIVSGTTWQEVQIPWTDLQAAAAAPKFSAAALNQIVFPFSPNANVDFYIDDVAFLP
jgi:hypothetical protein